MRAGRKQAHQFRIVRLAGGQSQIFVIGDRLVVAGCAAITDPFDEFLRRHGACEVEALALIAGEVTQDCLALRSFDAFGYEGEPEGVR